MYGSIESFGLKTQNHFIRVDPPNFIPIIVWLIEKYGYFFFDNNYAFDTYAKVQKYLKYSYCNIYHT